MTELTFRSDIAIELIQYMGSDEIIAKAAKASTGSDQLTVKKFSGLIDYLMRENHTSPFEHCYATFRVEAPITVAREWMRHRTQSYSELSMRFSEASPEFYIPAADRPLANAGSGAHPDIVDHEFQSELHSEMVSRRKVIRQMDWAQYQWEIENGIANEVSRDNVPVSTYTAFWATANLNNWFKFLYLRNGDVGAPQHEIVEGAQKIQVELGKLFPSAYASWAKKQRILQILWEKFPEALAQWEQEQEELKQSEEANVAAVWPPKSMEMVK